MQEILASDKEILRPHYSYLELVIKRGVLNVIIVLDLSLAYVLGYHKNGNMETNVRTEEKKWSLK